MKIFLLNALLCLSLPAAADTISGKVVRVADGDTLTILSSEKQEIKVRLAAIDAPEKAQPFGERSKQSLSEMCFGKSAMIFVVDQDKYGRTVGLVTCDGIEANRTQVSQGMAWAYRKHIKGFEFLIEEERKARSLKSGLWADPDPTPPWEWRKARKD